MMNLLNRRLLGGRGLQYYCSRNLSSLICSPVLRAENYFELFGITEQFPTSPVKLSERFKHLQRKWHPDKFVRSTFTEQKRAADISSRLNVAYEVLRTPHRCAKHLLHLKKNYQQGQSSLDDDQESPLLADAELSSEFLMWIMEFRGQLETTGNDLQKLKRLREQLEDRVQQSLTDLTAAFDEDRLDDAVRETAKLQYYASIQQVFDNR